MDKIKKDKLLEIRSKQQKERVNNETARHQELVEAINGLTSLFGQKADADLELIDTVIQKLSAFEGFKQEIAAVKQAIKELPREVKVSNLSELINSRKEVDFSEVTKAINNLSELVKKQSVDNVAISNQKPEDFIPTRRVRQVQGRLIYDDDPLQVTVVGGGGGTIAAVQPELIENGKVKVTTEGAVTERYDLSNSDIIYTGTATVGTAESAASWTITKYDLTDESNSSGKVALNAIWSDRLTETYA